MSFVEVVRTAIANTFRSRLRTVLTVLAIFVGAFTLTLTNGLGTGITNYVNSQLAALGGGDILSVSKASLSDGSGFGPSAEGPVEYDPDRAFIQAGPGFSFEALTGADIDQIEAIDGIVGVEPIRMVGLDFIAFQDGTRFEISIDPTPPGFDLELVAGGLISADGVREHPAHAEPVGEVLLPVAFVEPLGLGTPQQAIGELVTLALSDPFGNRHEVPAVVVGVKQASLFGGEGVSVSPTLLDQLFSAQTTGLPTEVTNVFQGATATLAPGLSDGRVAEIKSALEEVGLRGLTLADQLGAFNTVVNTIIGVLNAFAVIALIAAGFGIINTLLMSVQERTREIGLMKALGMGAGKIFALFSTEAVFIGFLGSAIGALVAIALGTVISQVLADGILADLAGLRILSFDPLSVLGVTLLVMLIAFLAGTLPARRAAALDPIEALRYE